MNESQDANNKAETTPQDNPKVQVADTDAVPSGVQMQPKRVGAVQRRRAWLIMSFCLCVILPSICGAIYYWKFAADRYAASASFVVRGVNKGGPVDMVSSFTGLASSGSTASDSYIIRRYLLSPDLILDLENQLQIQAHYSASNIDFLSRFDDDLPFEDFARYWKRRITTTYDSTTGIVTFEVQAFDAKMALQLAESSLTSASRLVNDLSANARAEAVQFAQSELTDAETRLRQAQLDILEFRTQSGTIDPSTNAQIDAELVGSLLGRLADVQSQIETLQGRIDGNGPLLRDLENRKNALQSQIDAYRSAIGTMDSNTMDAERLAQFENLQIEHSFAQQRYASALTSLAQARVDADRHQRYLAVFSRPLEPQDAIYPQRFRNALLIIAASFVAWAIATLLTYAVRDHLR